MNDLQKVEIITGLVLKGVTVDSVDEDTNDYMTDGEIDGIKLAKLGTKNKWR